MIKLDRRDLKTRYFLWCLRNLPCRAEQFDANGKSLGHKPVEWYMENGTNLCHFFWCCLWCPLIFAALLSAGMAIIAFLHVQAYKEYGTPGLLLPSGILVVIVSPVALVILAIIGAGKAGLLPYLAALKAKICPRISFE